jgi:hypothetical protein
LFGRVVRWSLGTRIPRPRLGLSNRRESAFAEPRPSQQREPGNRNSPHAPITTGFTMRPSMVLKPSERAIALGLRCSGQAGRPHAASLPVRVPTVEGFASRFFRLHLEATPCGWLFLRPIRFGPLYHLLKELAPHRPSHLNVGAVVNPRPDARKTGLFPDPAIELGLSREQIPQ